MARRTQHHTFTPKPLWQRGEEVTLLHLIPPPPSPPPTPGSLENRLLALYRTLGQLQSFVWLNFQAFSKIMKKYDKHMNYRGTKVRANANSELTLLFFHYLVILKYGSVLCGGLRASAKLPSQL